MSQGIVAQPWTVVRHLNLQSVIQRVDLNAHFDLNARGCFEGVANQLSHGFGKMVRINEDLPNSFFHNKFDLRSTIISRTKLGDDFSQNDVEIDQLRLGLGRFGNIAKGGNHVAQIMRALDNLLRSGPKLGVL